MKLKEFVLNRNFDINCDYSIYYGTHDNGGELLWDTSKDGRPSEDDFVADYNIAYVTVDAKSRKIIFEVA